MEWNPLFWVVLILSALSGSRPDHRGTVGSKTVHGLRIGADCKTIAIVDRQAWANASAAFIQKLVLEDGVKDASVLIDRITRELLPDCTDSVAAWGAQYPMVLGFVQQMIDAMPNAPAGTQGWTMLFTGPNGKQWQGPWPLLRAVLVVNGQLLLVAQADLLGVGGTATMGGASVKRLNGGATEAVPSFEVTYMELGQPGAAPTYQWVGPWRLLREQLQAQGFSYVVPKIDELAPGDTYQWDQIAGPLRAVTRKAVPSGSLLV